MDIFDVEQILQLHRLSDDEWQKISRHPKFLEMVKELTAEWNAATNTRERVKIKSATGLESQLEVYIRAIGDEQIPLSQRVEAGKFLARLGELEGKEILGGPGGGFQITLNIGEVTRKAEVLAPMIDAQATRIGQGVLPE